MDGDSVHHRLALTLFFFTNPMNDILMKFTILFLVLASFASYRNMLFHLEHENHEGTFKWSLTMLVFIIATLVMLFG